MVTTIKTGATIIAGLLAIAATIALSYQRHVLAGTLFLFTAFSIYVRETVPTE